MLDCVLKKDPNNVETLNWKGIALERLGEYDKALACYDA